MSEQLELLRDIKSILHAMLTQETEWIAEVRERQGEIDRKSEEDRTTILGHWQAQYDREEALKQLREQEYAQSEKWHQDEAQRLHALQERQEEWRKEDVERIERQTHLATKVYQAEIRQIYGVPQEPIEEVLP